MQIDQIVKYSAVVALLIPIGAVGAARHFGAGPQSASAAVVQPVPELPVFGPEQETPVFDAAMVGDPFWRDTGIEDPLIDDFPDPGGEIAPPVAMPEFALTSVMPHATRPLAVIDGRARKIGDTVAPGWELVAIDGRARSVTVRNRRGRTHTVKMQRQMP